MGIGFSPYPTYVQSFNFRTVVLLTKKALLSNHRPVTYPISDRGPGIRMKGRFEDRNPQSKFALQIAAKPLQIAEWLLYLRQPIRTQQRPIQWYHRLSHTTSSSQKITFAVKLPSAIKCHSLALVIINTESNHP